MCIKNRIEIHPPFQGGSGKDTVGLDGIEWRGTRAEATLSLVGEKVLQVQGDVIARNPDRLPM